MELQKNVGLPSGSGGGGEEVEDGAVDLTLHRFRGLFAEVTEDAVVEDDVPGCTRLDGIISRFTTLDLGTEQVTADVHLSTCAVDETA